MMPPALARVHGLQPFMPEVCLSLAVAQCAPVPWLQATFTIRGGTSAQKALDPVTADAPGRQPSSTYQPATRLFFRAGDAAIRWVPHPSVLNT
jgi:hypothetical protein